MLRNRCVEGDVGENASKKPLLSHSQLHRPALSPDHLYSTCGSYDDAGGKSFG